MKVNYEDGDDYQEYVEPLTLLESAFKAAGMNIEFELNGFTLAVAIKINGKVIKRQSIYSDSLPQAIKDVCQSVRL